MPSSCGSEVPSSVARTVVICTGQRGLHLGACRGQEQEPACRPRPAPRRASTGSVAHPDDRRAALRLASELDVLAREPIDVRVIRPPLRIGRQLHRLLRRPRRRGRRRDPAGRRSSHRKSAPPAANAPPAPRGTGAAAAPHLAPQRHDPLPAVGPAIERRIDRRPDAGQIEPIDLAARPTPPRTRRNASQLANRRRHTWSTRLRGVRPRAESHRRQLGVDEGVEQRFDVGAGHRHVSGGPAAAPAVGGARSGGGSLRCLWDTSSTWLISS